MILGTYILILSAGIFGLKRWERASAARHGKPGSGYQVCAALFAVLMSFAGILAPMMQLMVYDYYLIFTDKRRATVETVTGIHESDDVQYKKYVSTFGGPDGSNRRLELKCRTDPMTMLETCCAGTVKTVTIDGMIYDAAALETQDADALADCMKGELHSLTNRPNCTGFYEYTYSGRRLWLFCYETGAEWYRIEIRA